MSGAADDEQGVLCQMVTNRLRDPGIWFSLRAKASSRNLFVKHSAEQQNTPITIHEATCDGNKCHLSHRLLQRAIVSYHRGYADYRPSIDPKVWAATAAVSYFFPRSNIHVLLRRICRERDLRIGQGTVANFNQERENPMY